jgi:cell division protein FtsB
MKKNKEIDAILSWSLFIAAVIVAAGVFLYPLYQTKKSRMAELEARKKVLVEKERINEQLASKVDALENSPEAVEKEAREKFHMARPGEKVLIYDNNKKNAGSADEIK